MATNKFQTGQIVKAIDGPLEIEVHNGEQMLPGCFCGVVVKGDAFNKKGTFHADWDEEYFEIKNVLA